MTFAITRCLLSMLVVSCVNYQIFRWDTTAGRALLLLHGADELDELTSYVGDDELMVKAGRLL
jgi:hypothetical protein